MKTFENIKDLFKFAENRNSKITLDHLSYKRGCLVEHMDGSVLFVTNVKIEKAKFGHNIVVFRKNKLTATKKYISEICYLIFSEHHVPLVYIKSDLLHAPKIITRQKNGKFPALKLK